MTATATEPAVLGVAALAKLCPSSRGEKPTHPATVIRWITKGVRLSTGQRLKLEAKRYPGGWASTSEALARFIDALTRDRQGEPVTTEVSLPSVRRRAHERAERELDRAGL